MFACPGFSEPHRGVIEKDCLLPVSPLVEAEMMRIDSVLSNFGDYACEAPPLLHHQTPQMARTCKKRTCICHTPNLLDKIKSRCLTAKRQELRHNVREHLGGQSTFSLYCHFNTHNSCFLAFGSHLHSRFYRWAWCKDSGAGLESV